LDLLLSELRRLPLKQIGANGRKGGKLYFRYKQRG
jgi:hypothetical protein